MLENHKIIRCIGKNNYLFWCRESWCLLTVTIAGHVSVLFRQFERAIKGNDIVTFIIQTNWHNSAEFSAFILQYYLKAAF